MAPDIRIEVDELDGDRAPDWAGRLLQSPLFGLLAPVDASSNPLAPLPTGPISGALSTQAPAMLAMLETIWLQLGPTMRALYDKLRRRDVPQHHRLILAALRAGDEPGLRLAVRTDVTQGLRHLAS